MKQLRYRLPADLLLLALPTIAFAQTQGSPGNQPYSWPMGPGMMGNYGYGMMGGYGGAFGWLFMLLFWIILFGFLVWLVIYLTQHQRRSTSHSALEILQRRYAQGEINKEEYDQKKKDLLS